MQLGFDQIHSARAYVQERLGGLSPRAGVVLGSGLGSFAERVKDAVRIPYSAIPHFPTSTVDGHHGQLVGGTVDGKPVLIMQGRVHGYEGYEPQQVVFGVRVMMAVGVKTMVITNAAGGIQSGFKPGDLMLLRDHINPTGRSPLTGPADLKLGPRFPDMSQAYPSFLRDQARKAAAATGSQLKEGVYLGLNGPQYETPAEVQMCRAMGADAVGMSTVWETIACAHQGVPVLGISCITNLASGIGSEKLSHEEVKDTAKMVETRFGALLWEICRTT